MDQRRGRREGGDSRCFPFSAPDRRGLTVCLHVQILNAPAGGKTWPETVPEVQYYGPNGKDWVFAN